MGARGRGARAAAALRARGEAARGGGSALPGIPAAGGDEPLYPRLPPLRSLAASVPLWGFQFMLPARRGGGGGRGRRGRHAPTPPAPADPRAAAAAPGPAERSVLGDGERGTGSALPALLPGGSRGSPRPRLPRRCLFLLAEMTRRLLPPENISK